MVQSAGGHPGQLSAEELAMVRAWIEAGAPRNEDRHHWRCRMKDKHLRPSPGRRDFMRAAIVGIGGLISAAIGLPAVAYVIGPALKQAASSGSALGSSARSNWIPQRFSRPRRDTDRLDQHTGGDFGLRPDREWAGLRRDFQHLHTPGLPGSLDCRGRINSTARATTACLPRTGPWFPARRHARWTALKARSKTAFST